MISLGSVCTGVGGLDLAVEAFYDAAPLWHAEVDPAPAAVLEQHWPGVPNLGDLHTIQWEDVPRVDILCGGYPCQPFSHAGRRRGTDDPRHLWPLIADAVRALRPGVVVLENVAGHLSLGFDVVLGDLAAMGYDARWGVVRASDAGAPHRRARLFVVAEPADAEDERHERGGDARGRWARPAYGGAAPADARGQGPQRTESEPADGCTRSADRGAAPADAPGERRTRSVLARTDVERDRQEPTQHRSRTWGPYWSAVARWETILGEPAPPPVDDNGRLHRDLPRWMMGYPPGWLDQLTRTQALRAAGNAVCPQQAALALALLEEVA